MSAPCSADYSGRHEVRQLRRLRNWGRVRNDQALRCGGVVMAQGPLLLRKSSARRAKLTKIDVSGHSRGLIYRMFRKRLSDGNEL